MYVCVRACVRVCVRACVRACVCVCKVDVGQPIIVYYYSEFVTVTDGLTNNLALGKPTEMSSLYNNKYVAARAVDGDRNSDFDALSCFHTTKQNAAWWRVDLQAVYVIREVILTNRAGAGEFNYITDLK